MAILDASGKIVTPIIATGNGNVIVDCKHDYTPVVLFNATGSTTLTFSKLPVGANGVVLIRNNAGNSIVTISNSIPSPVPIFSRNSAQTLVSFYYDGTNLHCNSNVRQVYAQFPFYEATISASITNTYNISCSGGELASIFMRGSVTIGNSNTNYWQFTVNDSTDTQADFVFNTKQWINANTISYVSLDLSPRLRVFNGSMKLKGISKIGSPGNIVISVLSLSIFAQ